MQYHVDITIPSREYLPSKQNTKDKIQSYPAIVQQIDLVVLNQTYERALSPGEQFEIDLKRSQYNTCMDIDSHKRQYY